MLAACRQQPVPPAVVPTPVTDERSPALDAPADPPISREQFVAEQLARAWWHRDELKGPLGLGPEQLAAMDQALVDYLSERAGREELTRRLPDRIGEALRAEDWERARELGELVAEESAELARTRVELKIAVLSQLTPEQRRLAAAEFPRLYTARWMRGGQVLRLKQLDRPQARRSP
jgi:hypothetical protein